MKRPLCLILALALAAALCACGGEPSPTPSAAPTPQTSSTAKPISLAFINRLGEGDVWLLPNTESVRKTSLWGTATVAGAVKDGEYTIQITPSENGEYLFKMIDKEGLYYSSGAIELAEGYTLILRPADLEPELEILNAEGKTVFKELIFCAAL